MKKVFTLLMVICLVSAFLVGCTTAGSENATDDITTVAATEYIPKELVQPLWTVGTLSEGGEEITTNSALRTSELLFLADYGGAVVNPGYALTYYAFDENRAFLGRKLLESGVGFSVEQILDEFPDAVWFRVLLDTVDQTVMTVKHATWSCVEFYGPKDEAPQPEQTLSFRNVIKMSACQDGAIYNGKVFSFTAGGSCTVYDLETGKKAGFIYFASTSPLIPHANSVCFGNQLYEPGDQYPLLYANIYNNYSDNPDRMEGTCCVYRLVQTEKAYILTLVQVIKIGFADDLLLWLSPSGNSAPYGNFVVDTDRGKLVTYVMRNESNSTRFFEFDVPPLEAGEYCEEYGCNVVTLDIDDCTERFDVAFSMYIQGGCYRDGKIYSIEGMDSGSGKEPALKIIDLENQTIEATYYLSEAGLFREPEMIDFDPDTGVLYYSGIDGQLRILTIHGELE